MSIAKQRETKKDKSLSYFHEYYLKNKSRVLDRMKTYYANHTEQKCEYQREYHRSNKEAIKIRHQCWLERTAIERGTKRKLARILLISLLTDYNPMCQECGYNTDMRALQIEHRYSDGYKDRKRFKNSVSLYEYYLNTAPYEETRDKLQVLCANCNIIKMRDKKEWGKLYSD